MTNTKERNYGLDIVRVVSMVGIIMLHVLGAGGILSAGTPESLKYWLVWMMELVAYASVDLFALLSGFLNGNKKKFSSYRILELVFTILVLSFVITTAFAIFRPELIEGRITGYLFPPLLNKYWYITCYIGLFFMMPYLNVMIHNLSDKQLGKMCAIMILLFSVLPTVTQVDFFRFENGYSMVWLVVCYIIGAYIAKTKWSICLNKELLIIIGLTVVHLLSGVFVWKVSGEVKFYFLKYTSPLILLTAILGLQFFYRMKTGHWRKFTKKCCKNSGAIAFDVFIVHGHILLYENYFTSRFIEIYNFPGEIVAFVILGIAVGIYIICGLFAIICKKILCSNRIYKEFLRALSIKLDNVLGYD